MRHDDDLHTWRGIFGAAVVGCVLWMLICWAAVGIYFHFFHACPIVRADSDYLADRWTVERHKYHGIHASTWDPATGERYFIRDGKRCKL